jgi:hypothetical protein
LDPPPRDPIEENSRLTSMIETLNPSPPELRKAFGHHNTVEGVPADRVEGFTKVKLKKPRWGCPVCDKF